MHVVAFALASSVELVEEGGLRIDGFPMTSAYVDVLPKQITVPLVLAVYTSGGLDHDAELHVVAKSPQGRHLGSLELRWEWPDVAGSPIKHWVTTRLLPIQVDEPGIHTIGLFEDRTGGDSLADFPVTVSRFNPLVTRQG